MFDEIGSGPTPGGEAIVTNTVCANVHNKTLSSFVTFLLYKYLFATQNFYHKIDFFLFFLKVRYDVVKRKSGCNLLKL